MSLLENCCSMKQTKNFGTWCCTKIDTFGVLTLTLFQRDTSKYPVVGCFPITLCFIVKYHTNSEFTGRSLYTKCRLKVFGHFIGGRTMTLHEVKKVYIHIHIHDLLSGEIWWDLMCLNPHSSRGIRVKEMLTCDFIFAENKKNSHELGYPAVKDIFLHFHHFVKF